MLPALKKEVTSLAKLELDQNKWFLQLQQFTQKILNSEVDDVKLEDHPTANAKYLPISEMEMQLDELFFGQWNTFNFKWEIILNEIVGSIEISVLHPISKFWLKRTGASAVKIMVDSLSNDQKNKMTKQQINEFALNTSNKKAGALSDLGQFARLKADCFKNGCLSIGKSFGRDVNRKHKGFSDGMVTDLEEKIEQIRKDVSDGLEFYTDTDKQKIIDEILTAEEKGTNTLKFYNKKLTQIKGKIL